jgi:hypothetical protein
MMAYQGSYDRGMVYKPEEISGWAVGFTFLGSMLMVMLGAFHLIEGIAALIDDDFYVLRENFALEIDVTAWGWIHTLGGIAVMVAGIALLSGNVAARLVTILICSVSIIWNFYSIPYYPVWSIMMIAFAIGVIWALTVHGHEFSDIMKSE